MFYQMAYVMDLPYKWCENRGL